MLTETAQVLQVILFGIPVLALLAIGIRILTRSVSIVDQRWHLAVFIPLLLANTLAILAGDTGLVLNWRAGLILGTDLALIVGVIWVSHGFQVYGLTAEDVEMLLVDALSKQGFTVDARPGEKSDLWGRSRDARLLAVQKDGQSYQIRVTVRFNEVLLRADRREGRGYLRQALPALQQQEVPYAFQAHTVGVLYIVLALVFALLVWIFFFEPRLILIE